MNMMVAGSGSGMEIDATSLLGEARSAGFGKLQGKEDTAAEMVGTWLKSNQQIISRDQQLSPDELDSLIHFLNSKLKLGHALSPSQKSELKVLVDDLKETKDLWNRDLKSASRNFSIDAVNANYNQMTVSFLSRLDNTGTLRGGLNEAGLSVAEMEKLASDLLEIDAGVTSSFKEPYEVKQTLKTIQSLEANSPQIIEHYPEIKFMRAGLEQALAKYDAELVRCDTELAAGTMTAVQSQNTKYAAVHTLRRDLSTTVLMSQSGTNLPTDDLNDLMQHAFTHGSLTEKIMDQTWRPSDFVSPRSYTVGGMQEALDVLTNQHQLVRKMGDPLALNLIENKISLIDTEMKRLQDGSNFQGDRDVAFLKLTKSLSLLDLTSLTSLQEMLKLKKKNLGEPPVDPTARAEFDKKAQVIDKQLAEVKVERQTTDSILASLQDAMLKVAEGKAEAYGKAFG